MRLPTKFRQFLDETGGMTLFTGRFFSQEFRPRFEFRELIAQCYIIGYNSLYLEAMPLKFPGSKKGANKPSIIAQ